MQPDRLRRHAEPAAAGLLPGGLVLPEDRPSPAAPGGDPADRGVSDSVPGQGAGQRRRQPGGGAGQVQRPGQGVRPGKRGTAAGLPEQEPSAAHPGPGRDTESLHPVQPPQVAGEAADRPAGPGGGGGASRRRQRSGPPDHPGEPPENHGGGPDGGAGGLRRHGPGPPLGARLSGAGPRRGPDGSAPLPGGSVSGSGPGGPAGPPNRRDTARDAGAGRVRRAGGEILRRRLPDGGPGGDHRL